MANEFVPPEDASLASTEGILALVVGAAKVQLPDLDEETVALETLLKGEEGLDLDSLDAVELIMKVEEGCTALGNEVEIPDKVAEDFITVGDVVKFIATQVGLAA